MIERTETNLGLKPEWLVADTAYGSASNLALVGQGQEDHAAYSGLDKSNRTDGTFSRADFTFDADAKSLRSARPTSLLVQFRRSYDKPRSGITKAGTKLTEPARETAQSAI